MKLLSVLLFHHSFTSRLLQLVLLFFWEGARGDAWTFCTTSVFVCTLTHSSVLFSLAYFSSCIATSVTRGSTQTSLLLLGFFIAFVFVFIAIMLATQSHRHRSGPCVTDTCSSSFVASQRTSPSHLAHAS